MKSKVAKSIAVAVSLAAAMASATVTDDLVRTRAGRSDPVTPGVWHADLVKARAYAEANGLPLVAVWSNGDFCQHCLVWEGVATSPLFVNWMKSSGMVFYFGYVKDGYLNAVGDFGGGPSADGQEGYHGTSFYWCCNNQNSTLAWPYIRFYWPKGGVDEIYTGSTTDGEYLVKGGLPCMVQDSVLTASAASAALYAPWVEAGDYGTYNPGARVWIDFVSNKSTGVLRNFSAVPAYAGGEFDVKSSTEAARACLEVETNTVHKYVSVPLIRKDSSIRAYAAKNKIVATYPNGSKKEYTVAWVAKQKTAEANIEVSPALLASKAESPSIKLELYDQDNAKKGTLRIAVVPPVANSPANPLWIGERTVDSLAWGEWTMDIDAAKAKVEKAVKAGSKAYTLVLVGGSLWCPDCYALDEYLIDKSEFKTWAKNKKLACVAIDEPRFTASSDPDIPTLLSHTPFDSKTYGTISGSGWLSRHAVPLSGNGGTNAATVLARNLNYVKKDTAHGGLCLPEPAASTERKTQGWKTGVPAILVIRSNGSVAGRIYQFSNDGRNALKNIPVANLLKRLDELLAQADEAGEEGNDSVLKTKAQISGRNKTGVSAKLSFTDQADYYRIAAPAGTDISLTLSSPNYSNLVLSVVNGDVADPDTTPLATAKNAKGQAQVRCTLPTSNCYVKVSYPLNQNGYPVDSYFALGKSGSTLCSYTLKSDSVFVAQEVMSVQEITDGGSEVTVALTKGQVYKFTGLDSNSAANKNVLSYNASTGLWTAKQSGAVQLTLKAVSGKLSFGFQKWTPGAIEFVRSSGYTKEMGDDGNYTYQFGVRRTGGVSGTARAKVVLESTTATAEMALNIYEWKDQVLEWVEGSSDTKYATITVKGNKFADGDQVLEFKLQADGANVASVSGTYTLEIEDDDEAVDGRVALGTVAGVALPANRRVVVRGGSTLKIGVERVGGSAGSLAAKVSMGSAAATVRWISREADMKTVSFTVPAYDAKGSNKLTVTLSGIDGTSVVPSAKYLTVEVVPAKSAEFEETDVRLQGIRNVLFPERAVNVKATSLSKNDRSLVSVSKITGSVAPGLSWEFDPEEGDAGAILISGTPSRAGAYAATFQVSEDGVSGGTVTVSMTVTDPATETDSKTPAVNPYLATTRTIHNVMVISNDCLVGLMTVTVPPSGRLSAKYRPFAGNSVSLMSTNWSECVQGNYTAELDAISEDAADYGLSVTAKTNGKVEVTFAASGKKFKCVVPDATWTKAKPASAWKGYYTVSLPVEKDVSATSPLASGTGYVTLRMADSQVDSGKMTYAGVLPDGQAFSGMSILTSTSGKDARLPVVWSSGADHFSAVFVLNQSSDKYRAVWPYKDVNAYWKHEQASAPSASYVAKLGVYGALYSADAILNMEACCLDTFQTQYLTFFAQPDLLSHNSRFARGNPLAWVTNSTTVWVRKKDSTTKITLLDRDAAKAKNGLVLSFNPSSGIVSGSLILDFPASYVAAKFRGVVLPGWGAGVDCSDCTDTDATKCPFISGACWFNDTYSSGSETATVRRGCPFSVGVAAGK